MLATIPDTDRHTLERLNQAYLDAIVASDVARFKELLHDEFLCTNSDGTVVDKRGFLAQIAKPSSVRRFDLQQARLRVFGDVAFVNGDARFETTSGGHGRTRYTDAWQRAGSGWVCVSAHVTRTADAA